MARPKTNKQKIKMHWINTGFTPDEYKKLSELALKSFSKPSTYLKALILHHIENTEL